MNEMKEFTAYTGLQVNLWPLLLCSREYLGKRWHQPSNDQCRSLVVAGQNYSFIIIMSHSPNGEPVQKEENFELAHSKLMPLNTSTTYLVSYLLVR